MSDQQDVIDALKRANVGAMADFQRVQGDFDVLKAKYDAVVKAADGIESVLVKYGGLCKCEYCRKTTEFIALAAYRAAREGK